MIKKNFIIFLLLFVSFSSYSKSHKVEMLNRQERSLMIFSPAFLKIEVGDSITFLPSTKGHIPRSVFTPKGAETWEMKGDKEVVVKFEKEGVYIFECKNHYAMGMVGVIQVGKAKNLLEAKKFAEVHKKKISMNKERLEEYLKLVK
ncbi:pseudoazurin [Halobacteriovorax sp. JY17]|uniref:pseudoazurin n=1 Tax=Halobacteriovorax sp. JY17 TaxID=2014617 RepID=UPI000C6A92F3|nr:pseudoazurin [Halobacteriovorax sp. JY17]PIK13774.1 MAG: pseudoazurin [Halobacteriovorax sp. JY17]